MAKVLVTHPLPGDALDRLKTLHEVTVLHHGEPMSSQAMVPLVEPFAALIVLLSHTVDAEVLSAGPDLKVVSNYAVGFNNIDVEEADRRGIWVTNTPDVLTEATADLTWSLILACARRVVEGDRLVRESRFHGWLPDLLLGMELKGKVLGIVGMGRIGQAVARRAAGFGMKVLYSEDCPSPDVERAFPGASCVALPDLLSSSHVLSLHVPLTPETLHLIDGEALDRLPDGAVVINTSRGPVLDEEALVRALKGGKVRSAGLDVYEKEPEIHPGLLSLPNVVLLPHLGSATQETRAAMADLAVENVLRVLKGEPPLTPVGRGR